MWDGSIFAWETLVRYKNISCGFFFGLFSSLLRRPQCSTIFLLIRQRHTMINDEQWHTTKGEPSCKRGWGVAERRKTDAWSDFCYDAASSEPHEPGEWIQFVLWLECDWFLCSVTKEACQRYLNSSVSQRHVRLLFSIVVQYAFARGDLWLWWRRWHGTQLQCLFFWARICSS